MAREVAVEFPALGMSAWVDGLTESALRPLEQERCVVVCSNVSGPRSAPRLVVDAVEVLPEHQRDRPHRQSRRLLRSRTRDGRDLFSVAGARVWLDPGVGERATVQRVGLTTRPGLPIELMDLSLSHNLALQGGCVLHAAGFTVGDVVVVGVAGGRSGKSSVTVAAVRCGGRALSDDMVIGAVTASGELRVAPYNRDVYLREPSDRMLGGRLRGSLRRVTFRGETRWVVSRDSTPEVFQDEARPDVVWQMSIDRRRAQSRIEPMQQAWTLAALIRSSSSLFLSPRYPVERQAMIVPLSSLATSCRGYRVWLGRDLLQQPVQALSHLIEASTV